MRIDLEGKGQRPWWLKLGFAFIRRYLGFIPGPPLVLSFRPGYLSRAAIAYHLRSTSGSQSWDKHRCELLAAYVSRLNRCSF